jgi:glycosyltransferase involved in cell wall biosynthesis
VLDFSASPPKIDDFNKDFRSDLGLDKDDLLILQPTRVIQRKGIEMSIDIVKRLESDKPHLFITHRADDEGLSYWRWLKREASVMKVDVQLIDHVVGAQRGKINDHKIYSLWDAYLNADLITYPSLYEGFGNALLESIFVKKLTVVNRYPVYNADIKPLGFEFIELDGFVNEDSILQTRELLSSPDRVKEITDKNYHLAQEFFSLEVLEKNLKELIAIFK